jgi:membrane fusion protein (multidrug efflux system)
VRYLIVAVIIVGVLGGLAAVKFSQISSLIAAGEAMGAAGPPPEVVATDVAQEQIWENEISAVGTISAARGVTVSNEIAGEVKTIRFDSGDEVKAGQVLLELDSGVERAELRSALARRNLAKVSVERTRRLVAQGAGTQSQLDTDEAQAEAAGADVASLQAQIERKVVRAPFPGKLGIRQVNLGQYLNPGTTITELQSTDAVYVDFSLPQQELPRVAVGMAVRITGDDGKLRLDAPIAAIEPQVDQLTRSIQLRARVPEKGAALSPGMFVRVAVVLPEKRKVVVVPVTALVYASYGNSVFIVEDKQGGTASKVVRQQFVKTGESRGDFVAILEGVKAREVVVSAGAFKLRNGAGVVINDTVKPKPELAPRLENR